jgi:acid phosphatase type 7
MSTYSGEQYKWLKKDLASVDRSVTPWLIATWHAPWYSTYRAHYKEAECMRLEMEELLYSYGVDIVFNGHVRSNLLFRISGSFRSQFCLVNKLLLPKKI